MDIVDGIAKRRLQSLAGLEMLGELLQYSYA